MLVCRHIKELSKCLYHGSRLKSRYCKKMAASQAKSKYNLSICWLRNNLRYSDNDVLYWANENSENILAIYCFDPRHFEKTHTYGFPKTGPFRAKFLLESVQDLSQTLEERNNKLHVFVGKPEDVISDILKIPNIKADAIVFQKEVTKEEIDIENAVEQVCKTQGVKFVSCWDSTLYNLEDLRFNIRDLPNTYTEFRKSVESKSSIRIEKPMPTVLKPISPGLSIHSLDLSSITLETFNLKDPVLDPNSAFPFKGGERAARSRIQQYFWETRAIEKYKETRNGLIGSEYSTKFSSWLAFGCISPRTIYFEIKKYEQQRVKNDSTYWVVFELLWRDYFRFICLKFGTLVFYPGGLMQKKIKWGYNKNNFQAWADGKTGVPFVDANMRELLQTGWMSNRGRQNVASFLTKDLKLDWRLGAEWFEYLLIDYDVCSNYGNWNYSAGIGNDPREDRKFNMIKQGTDYDPEGHYIRIWVPELKEVNGPKIHIPWTLHSSELGFKLGVNYPFPIVTAPEWTRHFDKAKNTKWTEHRQRNQKGIDFYFKNSTPK